MATATLQQRLIPSIIDHHASEEPDKIYASIPRDNDDLSQGFRDITYRQLRKAVDKAAFWLKSEIGDATQQGDFEPFAYYGSRDLRYTILLVAAIKIGRKVLFSSLLCGLEAHIHLVKATDCHTFLCAPSLLPLVEQIKEHQSPSRHVIVPELQDWLPEEDDDEEQPCYPYTKTWDDAKDDPCLIVHTSGSTGLPKIVTYTNRMLGSVDHYRNLPPVNGCRSLVWEAAGRRLYVTIPIFHLLGICGALVMPVYYDSVAVLGPPDKPVTPELADQMHQFARLEGGVYPPSLLQDLVRDEEKRENLRPLKAILYGGAPLERTCGEWLATNLGSLRNLIGSTEGGMWPTLVPADPVADWDYIHFHPAGGATFVPVKASVSSIRHDTQEQHQQQQELYELVFERNPNMEAYTNFFHVFPHLDRWPTKDLWVPHPDPAKRFSHWRYQGRTDDLVLLSGEVKMYAAQLEARIEAHPLVRAALVGGNQRKWPFLLLEIVQQPESEEKQDSTQILDDQIWPWIEQLQLNSNSEGSTHETVQLRRSLVIVADAEKKPFVRVAKGSVNRNQTFKLYEREIDELYELYQGGDS
ncbi:hypothetical protein VTN77DRAFT_3187 [Rasamsonia byssochlamydoides]|uniref:uncharacterized protein n=1 Tax=Rasamsonia byssochlamydoides TaxID=89139 RepID=UPI0037426934